MRLPSFDRNNVKSSRVGKPVQPQFYRGRTTYSADSLTKIRMQKEYRRKKLSKVKRDRVLTVAGLWLKRGAIVVLLFTGLMQLRVPDVRFIGAINLSDGDKAVLNDVAAQYFGKSVFNRYFPFFDATEMEAYIRENTSFISDISVSTSVFKGFTDVAVLAKSPLFPFQSPVVFDNEAHTQWIATDGTLVNLTAEQVAALSDARGSLKVIDEEGVDYTVGQQVLTSEQLEYILQAQNELEKIRLQLAAVRLSGAPRDLTLDITDTSYQLLVSLDRPATILSTDFKKALIAIENRGVVLFEYIDLRVVDKVFYK